MSDAVRLVLPSVDYRDSHIEALREGFYRGMQPVKTPEEIEDIARDFGAYVARINDLSEPVDLPTGERVKKVPSHDYWLVEGKEFIGEASIRYELSEFLLKQGGHIGYGIRPSRQRRGYGSLALKLSLDVLRKRGVARALVTCDDGNIPSAKIIEANGGVLENKVPSAFHPGSLARRYWIHLEDKS